MRHCWLLFSCLVLINLTHSAFSQTIGIELENNVMPASGAMGGVSITQPQDVQSALNGNPATMTLFPGTQFSFGAAYAEPTYNVTQGQPLPLIQVSPFSGKSSYPGSVMGNIGLLTQASAFNRPVTLGLGFLTNAGIGVDLRKYPDSNGTHVSYLALDSAAAMAFQVTPRLSLGTTFVLGTQILDGPFVGNTGSQLAYAPRFTLGANYELGNGFSLGAYWKSEKNCKFANVFRRPSGEFENVYLDHPATVGMGIANRCLLQGRLLLAADVLFKQYSQADFFKALYRDQWALQLGSQFQAGPRLRLRAGYVYAEDPTLAQVPGTIGGVIPVGGIPAVQYIQGQFAVINHHRISGGFGIRDLRPGLDLDVAAGGMFEQSQSFGSTTASVESFWLAFGLTWRFGNKCQSACQ